MSTQFKLHIFSLYFFLLIFSHKEGGGQTGNLSRLNKTLITHCIDQDNRLERQKLYGAGTGGTGN